MDRKSLGVDRFELGGLSSDSQEYFGDLSHAGKTSYLRSQFNTDDFQLVKWRSGVSRSCEVCLSNTGVEEFHVRLVTGCQGRTGNGQLSMQGVVLQTWCGENSTHPPSCVVASTRRGTTTDCDHPACSEASFEHGRSASEGVRTWLRYVCMTLLVKRPTPLFSITRASSESHVCFASNSRLSLFFLGTAGSLLICNSQCDM